VPKRPIAQMLLAGVIGCAILIPIALVIPWFPSDASRQAHNIHTLYDVLLIASVPVFVLVETVVLYSVWKFRMKPGEEEKDGPPIHGNTRLEIVWTAAPALLIIALCTYAYTVLRSNEDSKKGEITVHVTERQFAFEFSWNESGKTIVSPELYMAKDQPVVFKITSLDVIHSFFVPEFSEKIDAVPGIDTTIRVTPTRLGTYPAECTELCGAGHSLMRATVHVVTPSAFQAWLSAQKAGAPPPVGTPPPHVLVPGVPGNSQSSGSGTSASSSSAASTGTPSTSTGATTQTTTSASGGSSASTAAGKAVFTSASAGCAQCHTLAAAGATGTVGPNLDQRLKSDCATPASKKIRGASPQQCILTAITKPYAYLPTGYAAGIMPATFAKTLPPAQIQALVNFLASVTK
jgi:cytochrome c oxidase subunit 2